MTPQITSKILKIPEFQIFPNIPELGAAYYSRAGDVALLDSLIC